MRVGVFGGTFDPIHRGHVEPVQGVRRSLDLDRILFLPTASPPHKDGPRGASALHRFAMVELALLDEPSLHVSDLEMETGRPSYTVDTLERLRDQRPDDRLFLVIGADSFLQLASWRNWPRILDLVEVAVMIRPGWSLADRAGRLPDEQTRAVDAGRVRFVENPPVNLSSSEIRRRLGAGEPLPDDALHPRVLRYTEKYGLYRHDFPTS